MPFQCLLCITRTKYTTTNFRRYCAHLRSCHPGSTIICNVNSCTCSYKAVNSYVRHVKQKHSSFYEKYWCTRANVQADVCSESLDSIDVPVESDDENDNNDGDIERLIQNNEENTFQHKLNPCDYDNLVRIFLLELREVKRASGVACEYVVQQIASFLRAHNTQEYRRLSQYLVSHGLSSVQVENVMNTNNPLLKALERYQFQTTVSESPGPS